MEEDSLFYQEFIYIIREKIPHKATLANIIADLLAIDKDAVYRRLRGDVKFSFAEMAVIAKKLGISLDKIAGIDNMQSRPAQINISNQFSPTEIDYEMFRGHVDLLKSIKDEPDTQIIEASNIIPHYLYQDYEHLTRYNIFRWNHSMMCGNLLPYNEVIIPERLRLLQKETCEYARHISSTTYVWDNLILQRLVTNIKYFVKVNLITEKDIALIKGDLMMLINDLEKVAIRGKFEDTGKDVSIFISDVASDTNYSCLKTGDINLTLIRAFILNATVTFDIEVFNYACIWIQAMQRMSTLISVSGEKTRAMYFEAQRKIVSTL